MQQKKKMMTESKTLQFRFDIDVLNDETKRIESKTVELSFCIDARDMAVGKFAELETYVFNLELWSKVALGLKSIESIDPLLITDEMQLSKWQPKQYNDFAQILIELLNFFCVAGAGVLTYLSKQQFTCYADVAALNNLFCDVFSAFYESHTPCEVEHFEHKGRRFIVPYNGDMIGAALTWGEATEALQSDYFTKPQEDGKYGEGVLLNNSLTILAALCREVRIVDKETGAYEEKAAVPNMQGEAWAAHLKKQKAFFYDLPCSISRDVGFFLTNSFVRSELTVSLALLFKSPYWQEIAAAIPPQQESLLEI
jgi:hypothetical protein